MLLFEGNLYDRSGAGSCLTTGYTDASVSAVYDSTGISNPYPWVEAVSAYFAVYYSDPGFVVGSVRVEVDEFRPEKSFYQGGSGTASISAEWSRYKTTGARIFFESGVWRVRAFSIAPITSTVGAQPFPTNVPLSAEVSFGGVNVFAGHTPSLILSDPLSEPLPAGGADGFVRIDFYVQTGAPSAYRNPSFFGDVRIYLDPYIPPVDPSAFWTNLTGTKETL